MSTTIDERIVEMRFDNKQFESNVAETMSTLDKFKQKLDFTGASKGLENLSNTANKVDMSGMSNAIQAVHSKFSALEVVGITALSNITNSAINAGKRLIKSLTIDPVMDGWREYELTMNTIQTIMNSTGASADDVKAKLKSLDDYADQTVYSTADMFNNIYKFTNAGIDLDTATQAMIGIANATADAGQGAQQASMAYYNLAQSLSTGYLTTIDYKSLNLANIVTKDLKQALADTAIEAGTLKKVGNDLYSTGKKQYNLQQLFSEALSDQWATTDVMMKVFGDYANAETEIGKRAWKAATEVKTFTGMMESLKAVAGTGWKTTWELVFGGLEPAKKFWTGLNDFISNIISGMAKFRNGILEGALGKSFKGIFDNIKKTGDTVKEAVKPIKEYAAVVDEIIGGKWGTGQARWDSLTQAGYDWAHAQNLVNEKLGSSVRHATNFQEAQSDVAVAQSETVETTTELILKLLELSDAELKAKGYTEDQIKAFRELEKVAKKTGIPLKDFIENIDEIDGRWLLINSFKNAAQGLVTVFTSIKDAWIEVFKPNYSEGLFNLIAAFHKFSTLLTVSDEAAKNLKDTFKGLFSILDLVLTIVGAPVKIALKLFGQLLKALDIGGYHILEFTGAVGRGITGFKEWIDKILDFTPLFEALAPKIKEGAKAVRDWFASLKEAEWIKKLAEYLNKAKEAIVEWAKSLQDNKIGENIFKGLINGLKNGVSKVVEWFKELGKKIIDTICKVLGIQSPSTEFFEIGKNIIQGLINGVKDGLTGIGTFFKNIGNSIKEFLGKELTSGFGFTIGEYLLMFLAGGGLAIVSRKITKAMRNIAKMMLVGLAGGLKSGIMMPVNAIIAVGKALINGIKKILGIHSPSTEFFEIGENIIQGLINGLKNLAPSLTNLFSKLFGSLEKIEWSSMANLLTFFATLMPGLTKLNIGAAFARLMQSIGVDSMDGLINGFKNCFGNVINVVVELGKSILAGIKNVLGIHSPSTEFQEIGENSTQGFVNGIQNGASAVWTALKNFGLKCIEIIKSIDYGKIFAAGLGVGLLLLGKTMLGVINNVTNTAASFAQIGLNATAPLKGVGNLLTDIGNGMENFSKGYKAAKRGEAIKDIAIAIGILAASIFVLSKIEPLTLWATIGAVTALTALMVGLSFAMSKMQTLGDSAKSALSGTAIASIGASLLLIALTLKSLSKIEPDKMKTALQGLAGVIVALAALLVVIGKFVKGDDLKNIHKVGSMISKISFALLLLVGVIKLASMLEIEEVLKGIGVIAALGILIAGLITISKAGGENALKAGKMISKIAWALLITIGVIKLASMLDGDEIAKGIAVIAGVGLLFSALIAVSNLAGKNATKAGWMLLQMSIALGLTVGIVKLASMLKDGEIKKGLTVITTLGLLFTALIAVSNLAGQNAIKAGTMLLMVSTALLLLSGVLFIISKMDTKSIWKAVGIVAVLEILMGGLIFVSQYANDCSKSIYAMIAAIVVLAGAVALLTLIDPQKLLTASGSIAIMMAGLALLLKSTSGVGDIKTVLKSLIPLIGMVGVMAILAAVLSKLDVNVSYETVVALSGMLLAMSGVLFILSKISTISFVGIGALALLTLIIGGLAAILGAMSYLNVEASMKTVAAISTLLLVMSGVLAILNFISPTAFVGLGTLAVLTLIVGGLAGILGLMSHLGIENAMSTAGALSTLLLAMSASLVVLGLVGLLGPAAFIGIGALATLIVGIGTVVGLIGALVTKWPMLEDFLNTGIPVLEKIGYALGSFFGNIVGGFMSGVSNGLPDIGANLSAFMSNLTPFIEGVKTIDRKTLAGVGILTGTILALTGAQLLSGIVSFLGGGQSFAKLGTELSQFMINAMPFIILSKQVDPSIMEGVKTLADAVLTLTGANILEGLTSWFTGGTSFETFASELVYLGEGLKNFITAVGPIGEDQVAIAKNAAEIIKTLAQAASEIPNAGGLLADLVGENDMATWATQLPIMAAGIVGFIKTMTDGGIEAGAVKTAEVGAKIIKKLAEAAQEIPNTGGLLAGLIGDNDLSKFATGLPKAGEGIVGFIKAMTDGEITEDKAKIANTAAEIIKTLASSASEIPNAGGLLAALIGDNDLGKFATQLPNVGKGIAGFAKELGEFGSDKLDTVYAACTALDSIVDLANIDMATTGSNLTTFGGNMVKFAKKIKEFIKHIGEVGKDNITSAIDKTKELIEMAKEIASINVESVKTFGESLKTVAKDGVTGFVKEFSGEEPKSKAKKAVEAMVQAGIDGADEKKTKVEEKFRKIAEAAVKAMCTRQLTWDAENAGKDLVKGFANGIKNNKSLASNAGSDLGKAALKAAKEAIDSHSPSKEAEKLGNFFGQGLVIGIDDYKTKSYDAGYGIAEYAKTGLSRAITKVSDMMNNGMDSNPTIRPVLDLSDVESGVGYLSSMFNNGPSLAVATNLGAISSGMNRRIQNGSNDDVVSAINKLGKNLGNVGGDTYNINGVSYDEESGLADAVKTIIRAAKVGRRS